MKKFFCFFFLFLICLLPGSSCGHFTGKGHVHTLSENRQVFLNPECRSTDTCDLKRFAVTTSDYEVWFGDDPNYPTHGTGALIEYETDSVAALEQYAVVQFIKGCVFRTSKNGHGEIDRKVSDSVPSFGETIPLCFPQWVIDSQDTDPAYNSHPEYGRFYLLRWNKPGSYDYRTQKFYGAEKPQIPVLYMTDHPSGAFVTGTGVKNAALEFKTCIYRASDVPARTRRDDINFAKPIACFQWQNVYVYDFDKAAFQTQLAAVPKWEAPSVSVNFNRILMLLVALLAALAAIAFSLFRRFCVEKGRR